MLGRSSLSRSGSFRPENLGQNALAMIGNLCFTLFVLGVLIFTIIAATYEPEDPLFHPSTKITTFLTSTSNATFKSDNTVVKTGEDFMPANQTAFATFINITDVAVPEMNAAADCEAERDKPIECSDPEIFHLMMRAAIEHFKDIHFYRFGKPVRGSEDNTCDMAWRFRPKEGKTANFYKDYRRFTISRSENCNFTVAGIGDYHTGVNARKRRKNQKPGFEKKQPKQAEIVSTLPVVGETVNDTLPVVESEGSFSHGKYLIYTGGGDRCKSMNHYLWSFLCSLGEAQYLNRTLVMDLTICLSSIYTSSNQDEEGKDFRFYFDFEHLKESASVLDQSQFWSDWEKWQKKDGLNLHLVEDFRVTPMKLADVKDTLIMRKFGSVEPDNYWYRVCEGETESVVQRPWHLLWKSRRLMDIVSGIASRLNWDFDSVHIVPWFSLSFVLLYLHFLQLPSADFLFLGSFFCFCFIFFREMEPANIDWKNIESRFVEDDLYEHINAPKWIDFSNPQELVDDEAWFCKPDCRHPKNAEDFLRSASNSKTNLFRSFSLSESPPLGDWNRRDANLKRRGPNNSSILSNKNSQSEKKVTRTSLQSQKFQEGNENENPNLSTPPPNHQSRSMKAAIKSSTEKKKPLDNSPANPSQKDRIPQLKNTLSARNLFAGREILTQITEFCNELKKLATRAKEGETSETLKAKSPIEAQKQFTKESSGKVLGDLNDRKKEKKPLLEMEKENSEAMEKSNSKEKQRRKKRADETENIPISVDLKHIPRGEESLLQVRTCPPSPQCFSSQHGPRSGAKTTPVRHPKSRQPAERGILQAVEQLNKKVTNDDTEDKDNMANYKDSGLSVSTSGTGARSLDVFWFFKPCAFAS